MSALSSKDCLTYSNYHFQNFEDSNEEMASNSRQIPTKRPKLLDSETEDDGKLNISLINICFVKSKAYKYSALDPQNHFQTINDDANCKRRDISRSQRQLFDAQKYDNLQESDDSSQEIQTKASTSSACHRKIFKERSNGFNKTEPSSNIESENEKMAGMYET